MVGERSPVEVPVCLEPSAEGMRLGAGGYGGTGPMVCHKPMGSGNTAWIEPTSPTSPEVGLGSNTAKEEPAALTAGHRTTCWPTCAEGTGSATDNRSSFHLLHGNPGRAGSIMRHQRVVIYTGWCL